MSSVKKAKGGRPPRAEGEKLQRVNLTLRPSLMFGLELLARAQGRSLSQAVEWALQVGLNNYFVSSNMDSIASVLDEAWRQPHPFDRLRVIYRADPGLLTFEERGAIEFVERSIEWTAAHEPQYEAAYLEGGASETKEKARSDAESARITVVTNFARAFWEEIRATGARIYAQGGSIDGNSIASVGLSHREERISWAELAGVDEFAVMQALSEEKAGEIVAGELVNRAKQLSGQLPWARKGLRP